MCVERFGIFALVGFLAFVGNGVAQVVEAVPGAETAVDSPSAEVHPESDVTTDEQPAFLRLERNEHGQPHAMQTAITRFQPKAGFEELTVDLVAALHIGDKDYYEQLNQQLANYDVVLYELVAPKGTVIPKGGGRGANDPISALQDLARQVLNLASQKEEVDYTKGNFVHADMSPEEIQQSMMKRGETPVTIVLDTLSALIKQANKRALESERHPRGVAQQGYEISGDPIELFLDPQRDRKLKMLLADQLLAMENDVMGETVNRILIQDRNKAAMKVLHDQVNKGSKRIAIFYGAAHLSDFEERLQAELGLTRRDTKWVTAWDLMKTPENNTQDTITSLLRNLLLE